MARIKLNNGDNYEHLCNVQLTEEKFPKVYAAKLDELVNVYSKANLTEKASVYETLYPLWPTEQARLDKIKKEEQK